MKKIVRQWFKGFTLLEVLVAMTSSSIVLGGFLIAFSNLGKVAKQSDRELQMIQQGVNVRSLITRALSDASNVVWKKVANASVSADVEMLYYFKYNDMNQLVEYGYFYLDEQQSIDPSYLQKTNPDGTNVVVKNLYYDKVSVDPPDSHAEAPNPPDPGNFNLRQVSRQTLVQEVEDFHVNLSRIASTEGADKKMAFSLDYQITVAYDTGFASIDTGKIDKKEQVFKGSTFALGKVTG